MILHPDRVDRLNDPLLKTKAEDASKIAGNAKNVLEGYFWKKETNPTLTLETYLRQKGEWSEDRKEQKQQRTQQEDEQKRQQHEQEQAEIERQAHEKRKTS